MALIASAVAALTSGTPAARAAATPAGDTPRQVAYVASGSTVSAYDITTGQTLPVHGATATALSVTATQPEVVSPDGRLVYVLGLTGNPGALATIGVVSVISTATNGVVGVIEIGKRGSGMVLSRDGARLYVSSTDNGTVYAIDTASRTVIAKLTGVTLQRALAISPDGRRLYGTTMDPTGVYQVVVIDTASVSVVARLPLAHVPYWLSTSQDGRQLYVGDPVGDSVVVLDPSTGETRAEIPLGSRPLMLLASPDGSRLYALTGVSVIVIDVASATVTATVPDTKGSETMALSPDGALLYLTPPNQPLDVMDTSTLALRHTTGPAGAWASIADVPTISGPHAVLRTTVLGLGTVDADVLQSTPGFFAITSYAVDFGDGRPSSGNRHTYALPGTYTVTLTVTDSSGRSDSTSSRVTVEPVQNYFAIKTSTQLYVGPDVPNGYVVNGSAAHAAAGAALARRSTLRGNSPVAATVVDVISVGGEDIVLKPWGAGYLRTDGNFGNQLVADALDRSSASVYQWIANADGSFSLRDKATGRYVSSNDGAGPLSADHSTVGPSEKFVEINQVTLAVVPAVPMSAGSTLAQTSVMLSTTGSAARSKVITGWSAPGQRLAAR